MIELNFVLECICGFTTRLSEVNSSGIVGQGVYIFLIYDVVDLDVSQEAVTEKNG
jgi:hypothetical protein